MGLRNTTGDLYLAWKHGANETDLRFDASALINDSNWHHIAITQKNLAVALDTVTRSRMRVYIDGVQREFSIDPPAGIYYASDPSGNITLGNSDDLTSYPYEGWLIDFAVWSKELALEEILALSQALANPVREYEVGNIEWSLSVTEQPSDLKTAMLLLNSSSYRDSTDPVESRANHGFYFDQKAGSITYGDI